MAEQKKGFGLADCLYRHSFYHQLLSHRASFDRRFRHQAVKGLFLFHNIILFCEVDGKLRADKLFTMSENLKEKALKITEALYRTTDLFSDAEPLKWALRETALEIMSTDHGNMARMEKLVKNMFLKLELASSGAFVSRANFEVLAKAYSGFLRSAATLSDSYQNLLDSIVSDSLTANAVKQTNQLVHILSDKVPAKPIADRPEAILAMLKERGRSSVGEVAKMLGGQIGEKTVQRKLSSLVASGAIRQEGEKRWRRYFI